MSMRSLLITMALGTLGAASAAAQDRPPSTATKPSVEAYLCTFAGKCGGVADGPEATRAAPATKGFRFARPGAEQARVAAPTVRSVLPSRRTQRSLAVRPRGGTGSAYGARTPRLLAPAAAASVPTAAARPRADLMIGFELNSAQLSADGVGAAQVFARSLLMPELQGRRFLIEGHTDLRGGRVINRALSAKRAQAVADYLVTLGVDRSRLETRGLGSDAPLPGKRITDPVNRRVEAELIS